MHNLVYSPVSWIFFLVLTACVGYLMFRYLQSPDRKAKKKEKIVHFLILNFGVSELEKMRRFVQKHSLFFKELLKIDSKLLSGKNFTEKFPNLLVCALASYGRGKTEKKSQKIILLLAAYFKELDLQTMRNFILANSAFFTEMLEIYPKILMEEVFPEQCSLYSKFSDLLLRAEVEKDTGSFSN